MEENAGLKKGSSALIGSQSSSKARPSSQPNNPDGRERVSFLLDSSDRRKSSSFRGLGDTAMDTKAAISTKRILLSVCITDCYQNDTVCLASSGKWMTQRLWLSKFLKHPFLFGLPKNESLRNLQRICIRHFVSPWYFIPNWNADDL